MKEKISRVRLARRLYHQFRLYFYLGIAALLILLGVSKHPMISRVRIEIADISSQAVNLIYKPMEGLGYLAEYVSEYLAVHQQNINLKQENQKLLYWINRAEQLSLENTLLKKELHFITPAANRYWTGYVVTDNGGAFSRSVLVQLGRKDGIKKGFVALYNDGLLGRIEAVGTSTAQILLLTDYASRVPVSVGNNRYLGIVEGDNAPLLKLTGLPEDALINVGDYVSSSGHSGVYPQGLAVGTVTRVEKNNIWVRPFVLREETPFVKVVDYEQTGLLNADSCECPVCAVCPSADLRQPKKDKIK